MKSFLDYGLLDAVSRPEPKNIEEILKKYFGEMISESLKRQTKTEVKDFLLRFCGRQSKLYWLPGNILDHVQVSVSSKDNALWVDLEHKDALGLRFLKEYFDQISGPMADRTPAEDPGDTDGAYYACPHSDGLWPDGRCRICGDKPGN